MSRSVTTAVLTAFIVGCQGPAGPQGPEGAVGATGPQGPTGAQGPSGAAGASPKTNYVCEGTASSARGDLTFSHSVYEMTDGSLMASCTVITAAQEITSFVVYRATQTGATDGSCFVVADTDGTSSYGVWNMRANLVARTGVASYRNTGSTDNGRTVNLTCAKY